MPPGIPPGSGSPGSSASPPVGDTLRIGYVARAHGIRGEIVAVTHDPDSTTLEDAEEVLVGAVRYAVLRSRPGNDGWMLALEGVADRNQAEALRGQPIAVDRALIPIGEDEVFLADLVGCAVRLPDGTSWGTVTAIELGPQDRLVVQDDRVERLIPYVPELIEDVDLDARVVRVTPREDWPEEPLRPVRPGKTHA